MVGSIGVDNQESLIGVYLNAKIVKIKEFDELQKFGEAIVRIDALHGDETKTSDDNLPAALFYARSHIASVGTFNVGDVVLVTFLGGNRDAPVIEGKVTNLEEIAKVIPEYSESYGDIKGLYSIKIGCCIFFNEKESTMTLRFTDGTTLNLTKEGTDLTTSKLAINVSGDATITANSLKANVKGSASITAGGTLSLKGSRIEEN